MRWEAGDTSSTHRGGAKMSTKLASLTLRARENPKCKFTSLTHLLTEDFLRECYLELKRGKAPGIDGVEVEEYGENLIERLKDLVERMKAKRYRPKPVKRVYIPKADGTKRPLGIPTVEDKIVQMGIKKILEAIFEADFVESSYGFRPDRSCHDAIDAVNLVIMTKPTNCIVDMDIRKFFDTVDHKWMMECLKQRIADPNLLMLIGRFLKAGVMEDDKYIEAERGTPQGGVVSPVLANIYLHYVLDLWFEKIVKKQMKGYIGLIRYADDFVVCCQSKKEGEKFREMLKERLDKFGLKISEDKTKIIEFGRYVWNKAEREGSKVATFDFMGITHYCTKTRSGGFKLGRKTARARYWRKVKEMNEWLKGVRNSVSWTEWWKALGLKLAGHYRYYGISGNMVAINAFHLMAVKMAYKWINRRSQRKSYNWKQFQHLLKHNPLPKPKIYRPYPVIA